MDDTHLRGLLPTIGYLDSRNEGLNGIVQILREKLGHGRVRGDYTGRVPESQADIDLLLALRPDWWEYWLYAGVLRVRLKALEPKFRDYELGFAPSTGKAYFGRDAFEFLRSVPARAQAIVEQMEITFSPDAQARAFGDPGQPGDPERIIHLAERFVDTYEAFMDEAARIRGAALPDEFKNAQTAAAEFGSQTVISIRQFVDSTVNAMNNLPEFSSDQSSEEDPPTLTLTLEATIDDDVLERFTEGLRAGVISLGVDPDTVEG